MPLGLIELSRSAGSLVGLLARAASFLAVTGLVIATVVVGLPQNGEGYVFGAEIERPAQLALAGLLSIGALVARRLPGTGAGVSGSGRGASGRS